MNIVFAYVIGSEPQPTYAVAIFPAERTSVLLGGAVTKIRYVNHETWFDFSADPKTIQYLSPEESLGYARTLTQELITDGVIAGDPIPPAPARTPLSFPRR